MKLLAVILIGAICGLGAILALGESDREDEVLAVRELETPPRRVDRGAAERLPTVLVDAQGPIVRETIPGGTVDWKPRVESERERQLHVARTKFLQARAQISEPIEEEELYDGNIVELESGEEVIDGPWVAYHENGEIDEQGAYHMGLEVGRWNWWYENGAKKSVGQFENGDRVGDWTWWHENGKVLMEGTYVKGEGSGHWIMYHDNGRRWGEGGYVAGEISGYWQFWNEDGSVDHERSGRYEAGERVSE